MQRVQFEPAYVLNRIPYREDSALVDLLTKEHGLVRVVARGLRRKKSNLSALLQPFQPLLVSWQSKTDLGTLTAAEASSTPLTLTGDEFYAACYLNEILTRLLTHAEPVPAVFIHYGYSLARLAAQEPGMELILRQFEHEVLDDLGYSLPQQNWQADAYYQWHPEHGLVQSQTPGPIQGWHLSHIEKKEFTKAAVLLAAKHLSRQRLAPLLGRQPLRSREVWLQMKRGSE